MLEHRASLGQAERIKLGPVVASDIEQPVIAP
jgi:hypothetical protein